MGKKIKSLDDFLALLKGVKKTSDGYLALCPAHTDHRQSLSVREADGKILIHCHAGCHCRDILGTLKLEMADLFLDEKTKKSTKGRRKSEARKRQIEAVYDYIDASGKPFQVVRTRPKGFFQRHPDGRGGWTYDLEGIVPTLYRRDDVRAAIASGKTIYVVEGEKDVDNLRSRGLTATTNPGGASKWRDAYSDDLLGADLVIIPDNDEAGRNHAKKVAQSCCGRARSMRLLELPHAKDVTDWLQQGHTLQELRQLVDNCPEYKLLEEPAAASKPPGHFNLTDMGNAERLVHQFGDILHYCYERKKWLVWTGKVWEWDTGAKIKALAKETVRSIYREAAEQIDDSSRKELTRHAMRSESDNRVNGMVSLAQSEKGIPIDPNELDRDLWLFNCLSGTIDLRTGQLLPHQKDNLLTTVVPLEYEPTAHCPLWLKFLDEVTAGDVELESYLQRAIGYSLTGQTTEQCFFFLYGLGNNGKSTFLETIREMMGDYGNTIATETVMTKRRYTSGPQESLANLKAKRLVVASEVQEGRQLNVGLIKDLTGSDSIKADRKYEHEIEFLPTHKLWMRGNHKPLITETSLAIWRRVKLLPFTVTIPPDRIDRQLRDKLREELPGILVWAVRGCLDWQKSGLGEPAAVVAATGKYQQESDILNDFLEDSCVLEPTATVTKKELRSKHEEWREANNQEKIPQNSFKARLIERGITEDRVHGGIRIWRGIRLLTEGDRVTRATEVSQDFSMKPLRETNICKTASPLSTSKPDGDKTSEILAFWESLGRPLVHLGPGENCKDLTKLLSDPHILPRHLKAVKNWAQENGWARQEEGELPEISSNGIDII